MSRFALCAVALLAAVPVVAHAQSGSLPPPPSYAINPPVSDSPLQQQILRNYRSDLLQTQRELTVQNPSGVNREQIEVTRQLNAVNPALTPAHDGALAPAGPRRVAAGAIPVAMTAAREAPEAADRPLAAAAPRLNSWLLAEGRFLIDNGELFTAFCERVAASGVKLDRASLHSRALHPRYRGVARIWKPGRPLSEQFLDHGLEKTATYLESPVRAVIQSHRRLEWRLDRDGMLPFALLEELREEGFVHYVIAPVPFAAGPINALAWATKHKQGFPPEALGLMDAVLPTYSAVPRRRR